TDEVGAVNTLERLNDNCLNTQQVGALSSPVTGRTGTVFLTTEDDQRDASFLVVHRRIVDEGLWCIFLGEVQGVATGDINQLVSQTDVSEGTANHDLVVTTTRSQGVVVNAVRSEEHTSELQSRFDLVCRLLLEKKNPLQPLNVQYGEVLYVR